LKEIENILSFIVELDKLKNVYRKSKPVGLDRYENSAEHSWQVCLAALALKDFANKKTDIDRVIKMLLIHDLGEIDTGDIIVYAGKSREQKAQEAAGVERVLGFLSESKCKEYLALWYEFEEGETPEAKFARAIDRVPPLLQNLNGNGYTWRENHIGKEQVFTVNRRISEGSRELWKTIKAMLDKAVADGILK
jgi:putative hydrolases of HD superfamily